MLYDPLVNQIVSYKHGGLNAAVYTQITDVESECDGLLTYDRLMKPDPARIFSSNEKAIYPVLVAQPGNAGQGSITFWWPEVAGLNLYSALSLIPPIAWLPVTNQISSSHGTNMISLEAIEAARFFVLKGQ
jgi:hypothetical protein